MPRTPRAPKPIRGLLHPGCGPIVHAEVFDHEGASRSGVAVIDTGATWSAIDRELAEALALPSHGAARWSAVTDTSPAQALAPLKRAAVRLGDDHRRWEMDMLEIPDLHKAVDGYAVVALLGWNFLDQCTLVCNGPAGTFSLELPPIHGPGASRR